MEHTLKVTNVLSDPTRFNIYQYIIERHKEVSVAEIAQQFNIHPNVARLHLTKLTDINLLKAYSQKNGKGGRPSRVYCLSGEVLELNFPHRDYKMLSTITLETFAELGETGRQALYNTGKKYGNKVMERYQTSAITELSVAQKINILEDAGTLLGMYPQFDYMPEQNSIAFKVNNCPFKEVAAKNPRIVCNLHFAFLEGMFESLFTDMELIETTNMFNGCENCSYLATIKVV